MRRAAETELRERCKGKRAAVSLLPTTQRIRWTPPVHALFNTAPSHATRAACLFVNANKRVARNNLHGNSQHRTRFGQASPS
eukprot:6180390-Pleurochrysis_carterae.AAC.3